MPSPQLRPGEAVADEVRFIDLARFEDAALTRRPFDYCIVPAFVRPERFQDVLKDYPTIGERGSFPLRSLRPGPAFVALLEELKSDAFRQAVEAKFSVDLSGRPVMITVRGKCGLKDGSIHTDTESKIISLLLYMNAGWEENEGGRLRLLNSRNLEDYADEVPPADGTLLVFRRCDHSFHGHKPFQGNRKVIQLNWVTEQKFADRNGLRHRISAFVKKLNPFAREY